MPESRPRSAVDGDGHQRPVRQEDQLASIAAPPRHIATTQRRGSTGLVLTEGQHVQLAAPPILIRGAIRREREPHLIRGHAGVRDRTDVGDDRRPHAWTVRRNLPQVIVVATDDAFAIREPGVDIPALTHFPLLPTPGHFPDERPPMSVAERGEGDSIAARGPYRISVRPGIVGELRLKTRPEVHCHHIGKMLSRIDPDEGNAISIGGEIEQGVGTG